MVNPVKRMNRKILKQLSAKQKSMVQNIRQKKNISLSQMKVYKRAGASSGYSVIIKKKYKRK